MHGLHSWWLVGVHGCWQLGRTSGVGRWLSYCPVCPAARAHGAAALPRLAIHLSRCIQRLQPTPDCSAPLLPHFVPPRRWAKAPLSGGRSASGTLPPACATWPTWRMRRRRSCWQRQKCRWGRCYGCTALGCKLASGRRAVGTQSGCLLVGASSCLCAATTAMPLPVLRFAARPRFVRRCAAAICWACCV